MKNIIRICVLGLLLSSCGNDEISYPATYELESNLELGTTIVTQSDSGEVIEVDQIHALTLPLCEVFNNIQRNQDLISIILLSETELELNIDNGNGMISSFALPYSEQENVLIADFGLTFDGDNKIISKVCNDYTFAPSKNIFLAEANFCNVQNQFEHVVNNFTSGEYIVGDTLGLCLIQKTYRLR